MQKRQRMIPDQRFDLPQFESMLDLISAEFNAYNKAFFTGSNYIIKNWKIEDNGGLEVRVNIGTDSLLINSERVGNEGINYRPAGMTMLTKLLEDNATNYVEIEISEQTTGNDSVASWDTTANSGDGGEYIQGADIVYCQEPTIVSNTVSFSVAMPQRIKVATVVTSGGSIVSITDERAFLFHVATDWNFGGTRTDKTIGDWKSAYDALATSIREMKGTPSWVDAQGVSTQNLLERMNYILVDGGTIRWDLPKPAKGSLTAVPSDPNNSAQDGDTFTIDDGVTAVVFEFDSDASVSGGNTPVTIAIQGTAADLKAAVIAAINGHAFNVTATAGTGNRIELANDADGVTGNVIVTEAMLYTSLAPVGMSGGVSASALQWSAPLRVIAPSRAFEYTISAQSIASIADGEVIYVTLPTEGVAPGGPLVVTKVASGSYPISTLATRNYIIAYRSSSKIYFGNGWQSVELEDGESNALGDGPSSELLTAFGFPNEYTSKPPYTSNNWVSPGASFTTGISELDAVTEAVWNLVTGKIFEETVVSDGTAAFNAGAFVTLPAPFGLGANQTYQTGYNQLEVFFNTGKTRVGEDWYESANVGAGIGNRIQLAYNLPINTKILFRIQTGGGQDGTIGVNAPDIYDEGVLVAGTVGQMNFVGGGIQVTPNGPTGVDVTVFAPREMGKLYKNVTGSSLPAFSVLAFLDDGTVTLADADTNTVFDVAGINIATIPHNSFGVVIKLGSVPGALAGLGALPGAAVYLSDTAGTMSLTPPPNPLTELIIRLGRAEPPDGVATAVADDLWLQPEVISEP